MTPYQAYKICCEENKRIPESEPIILTDPDCSYLYAKAIIKGRWPEAEPIILTDPDYAYLYTTDIIKGRWPEAESTIKQDIHCWKEYCQHFNIEKEKTNWKVGL